MLTELFLNDTNAPKLLVFTHITGARKIVLGAEF